MRAISLRKKHAPPCAVTSFSEVNVVRDELGDTLGRWGCPCLTFQALLHLEFRHCACAPDAACVRGASLGEGIMPHRWQHRPEPEPEDGDRAPFRAPGWTASALNAPAIRPNLWTKVTQTPDCLRSCGVSKKTAAAAAAAPPSWVAGMLRLPRPLSPVCRGAWSSGWATSRRSSTPPQNRWLSARAKAMVSEPVRRRKYEQRPQNANAKGLRKKRRRERKNLEESGRLAAANVGRRNRRRSGT